MSFDNPFNAPAAPAPAPSPSPKSEPPKGEPKPKPKRRPERHATHAKGVARAEVVRVLDAQAVLEDGRTRKAVAALTAGKDEADLVVSVTAGRVREGAQALTDAHAEQDPIARMTGLVALAGKRSSVLRDAASVAVALDAPDKEQLRSGKDVDLAAALARCAPDVDVEPLELLL